MAFRMNVTQRDGGQKAVYQVNGEKRVSAKDASSVQLMLERSDLVGTLRQGDDLLIRLADGSLVRIDGYFACDEDAKPEVAFTKTAAEGDEWLLEVDEEACGDTASMHAVAWQPAPAAQSVPAAPGAATVAATATEDDDDGGVGALPLAGLGAAALGGLAAAVGGGGGGNGGIGIPSSGGEDGDSTAPDAPVINPTDGTTITGTAEPGAQIDLDLDGDGSGDVSIDVGSDGNWTYTPDTPLEDGDTVTATATDDAGNTSEPATQTVDASSQTPAIDSATDDVGDQTGELDSGDSSDDTTPTLNGSGAEAGATISVFVDDELIGSTEADSAGKWSFTADDELSEGEVTFTVSATDALGNESGRSDPFVLVIDTTAPAAPTIDAGDGSEITGTSEPGSTVEVDIDGDGTPDDSVEVGEDGNWSVMPETPPAAGTEITATATDDAGNMSDPASDTVDSPPEPGAPQIDSVVDDVEPLTGGLANGELSNDPMPVIAGSNAEGGASVSVFDSGLLIGTVTADTNGDWTYMVLDPLSDGPHSFTVSSGDGPVSPPFVVVIDATAPLPPEINPTDGSLITGTAEPGSTVTLDLDGDSDADGTVVVGENGEWSIVPEQPLEDGTQITATATDEAGNTSDPAVATVDVDAPPAPPQITVVLDDVGALTGNVSRGGVTDDTQPTISGTAAANATIVIFDGDTEIGSVTANPAGQWSFTPASPISEGAHSFTATATTAAGTSSESAGFALTVDTTAPAAPTINPTDGLVVTGTAEPGSTIRIDIDDDGTVDATVVTGGNGNWQYTPPAPIPDGTTITATATDAAGNSSPEASVEVDADSQTPPAAPTIDSVSDDVEPQTGEVANGGTSNDARPTISGSGAAPGSTVMVFDGTVELGSTTADAGGDWSFTPTADLGDGSHSFTATASNAAGDSSPSEAYGIVVDTVAPAAPVIAPSNGSEVSGTAEPGSTVIIDLQDDGSTDGTVTAGPDGAWSYTPPTPLEDGDQVSATASDEAGNVSPEATIEVDNEPQMPPAAPVIDSVTDDVEPQTGEVANGGSSNDARATISGSGAPANGTVKVFDGTAELGSTTADAGGNWSFTPASDLGEGSHSFTAVASNAAGDSDSSASYGIVVDTVAPDEPVIAASDGTEVSGTAEPGSTVMIDLQDDGTTDGTVTAGTDGSWSFAPATPLEDGDEISATATDEAGNESGEDTVIVDTGGSGPNPPTATVEITAITEDTGTPGDFVTEDTTPQVEGTLSEGLATGERVEVRIDSGAWADAEVSGTTWSYACGEIGEGPHTIEARVVGDGGLAGDTDSQAITIEAPVVENRAPYVQVSEADLLGIISAETLALIDFNGQALFAVDPDNNLSQVTVSFEPLLSVNLSAFTLRADESLAASLGLEVDVDNDSGLLGIIAPSSTLTITATDGGTMDNVAVNQLLGTVRYEQNITLVGVDVLNATRISATDSEGLSDSDVVGNLVDISLLNGNPPPRMAAPLEIKASDVFDDENALDIEPEGPLDAHVMVDIDILQPSGHDWAANALVGFP